MTAFLEAFEMKKSEAIARKENAEQIIVEIMETIRVRELGIFETYTFAHWIAILKSLSKADISQLPSQEAYKDLKGDLALKEREIKNAESTMEGILAGILLFSTNYLN